MKNNRLFGLLLSVTVLAFLALFLCSCSSQDETSPFITSPEAAEQLPRKSTFAGGAMSGMFLLTEEEYNSKLNTLTEDKRKKPLTLYFNKNEVPYVTDSETPVYFLPLDIASEEWESGEFTVAEKDAKWKLFIEAEESFGDKKEAIAASTGFRLLMSDGKSYIKGKLIFTGLPILSINNKSKAIIIDNPISEKDTPASITFYDPADGSGVFFLSADAELHVRGGTSRGFTKKSYKMSLTDKRGTKLNVSLCGMRKDDDWVLNAMYQEETKLRDMLSFRLWNELNAVTVEKDKAFGTDMRYIEVIINNRYFGLYGLMEPIDAKTFDIGDEKKDSGGDGFVYKLSSWEKPSVKDMIIAASKSKLECQSIEIKYPDYYYDGVWEPAKRLIYLTNESDGKTAENEMPEFFDTANLMNYWLFINIIFGPDNTWKNTYAGYRINEEKLYFAPWDCDISFGLQWNPEKNPDLYLFRDENSISKILSFDAANRLLRHDNGNASKTLLKNWEAFSSVMTADNVCGLVDAYHALITESGAMKRNVERWPESGYTEDTEYIKNFIKGHFASLDSYIRAITD